MNAADQILIVPAASPAELAAVRDLFLEYWQTRNLGLSVFNFDQELAQLPGSYAPPEGRLLLAYSGEEPAGCVALRKLEPAICEMKRLYLRPKFRGQGLGRTLAEKIIQEARDIGYQKMRLDTIVPGMENAIALYARLGFREIAAYRNNPIPGAQYLELTL